MEVLEFRPRRRRTYLIWAAGSAFVVLLAVAGVIVGPHVGGVTEVLILPGGVALILAPLTFNGAIGRTVLTDRGIQTGGVIKRSARWSQVAGIQTKRVQGRSDHGTRVVVRLNSGKSFSLAAPSDVPDGDDPEFLAKLGRIQAYSYAQRNRVG